jgi:RNA:NAD 2'-phosphotransferase (TPT1/KptA family)
LFGCRYSAAAPPRDSLRALQVGTRHGFPVVLAVDARRMRTDDMAFYPPDNGV